MLFTFFVCHVSPSTIEGFRWYLLVFTAEYKDQKSLYSTVKSNEDIKVLTCSIIHLNVLYVNTTEL